MANRSEKDEKEIARDVEEAAMDNEDGDDSDSDSDTEEAFKSKRKPKKKKPAKKNSTPSSNDAESNTLPDDSTIASTSTNPASKNQATTGSGDVSAAQKAKSKRAPKEPEDGSTPKPRAGRKKRTAEDQPGTGEGSKAKKASKSQSNAKSKEPPKSAEIIEDEDEQQDGMDVDKAGDPVVPSTTSGGGGAKGNETAGTNDTPVAPGPTAAHSTIDKSVQESRGSPFAPGRTKPADGRPTEPDSRDRSLPPRGTTPDVDMSMSPLPSRESSPEPPVAAGRTRSDKSKGKEVALPSDDEVEGLGVAGMKLNFQLPMALYPEQHRKGPQPTQKELEARKLKYALQMAKERLARNALPPSSPEIELASTQEAEEDRFVCPISFLRRC